MMANNMIYRTNQDPKIGIIVHGLYVLGLWRPIRLPLQVPNTMQV